MIIWIFDTWNKFYLIVKYFVRAENFANEELNNLAVFNFWMEAGTFMSYSEKEWSFAARCT